MRTASLSHPTLPEGSYIFVSKAGFGGYGSFGITLWRGKPTATIARGDIVTHRLVVDPATVYVSRIIGLPGDRIEYANRRLIVNDVPVAIQLGERDGAYQYAVERVDETDVTIAHMPERATRDFADVVPPDHLVGRVVKVIRPRQR